MTKNSLMDDSKMKLAGELSGFTRLRVSPIINACGIYTDLGGSMLSPSVWASLTDLNSAFVDLLELQARAGESVARLVGAESARVTPGASAGIALALAACIVRRDASRGEQLPDTHDLQGDVIMQRPQANAYKYLNVVRLTGAKVVLAGSSDRTSIEDIESAVGPRAGAIFVPAHLDTLASCVPLDQVIAAAKRLQVPVVVDAAFMSFPPPSMRVYAESGANLTCFSAKYYGGPNAGGFVSGDRAFIETIEGLEFTNHEPSPYKKFGRAFKMGRYEIAAVVLALEEWFQADHVKRLALYEARARKLQGLLLAGTSRLRTHLVCFALDGTLVKSPINALQIECDHEEAAQQLLQKLRNGSPSIRAIQAEGSAIFVTETLKPGQEEIVAKCIAEALRG